MKKKLSPKQLLKLQKQFRQLVIQCRLAKTHWTAFLLCTDTKGSLRELRCSETTYQKASEKAFYWFFLNEKHWEIVGTKAFNL